MPVVIGFLFLMKMSCIFFADCLLCWITGESVSQADVEKLVKEVDEFVLASHLHWALWGLLSVSVHYNCCSYLSTLNLEDGLLVCFCLMWPLTRKALQVLQSRFFQQSHRNNKSIHTVLFSWAMMKIVLGISDHYIFIIQKHAIMLKPIILHFIICIICIVCGRLRIRMWSSTSWDIQGSVSQNISN